MSKGTKTFFSVSIVDLEQVNVFWDFSNYPASIYIFKVGDKHSIRSIIKKIGK